MKKHIVIYGLCGGFLIVALKLTLISSLVLRKKAPGRSSSRKPAQGAAA